MRQMKNIQGGLEGHPGPSERPTTATDTDNKPEGIMGAEPDNIANTTEFKQLQNIIIEFADRFEKLTLSQRQEHLGAIVCQKDMLTKALSEPSSAEFSLGSIFNLLDIKDRTRKNAYANQFSNAAYAIAEELCPHIEEAALKKYVDNTEVLYFFIDLAKNGNQLQRTISVSYLSKNLDESVKGLIETQGRSDTYCEVMRTILLYGDDIQKGRALAVMCSEISKNRKNIFFTELIGTLFDAPYSEPYGWKIVHVFLEEKKLAADEISSAWQASGKAKDLSKIIQRNLAAIMELEKTKKGICAFLYSEFNIADYDRYPPEMLLSQYEEFERLDKPYGLIIWPRHDHTGAFYSDKELLANFSSQVDGDIYLRISECEDRLGIAKLLVRMDGHFNPKDGSGHKIKLLVLGGHGTKDSIVFGRDGNKGALKTEDFIGDRMKSLGGIFEENPDVILVSCRTGTDKGIGERISLFYKSRVTAPKQITGLVALHANMRSPDRKQRFSATYGHKNAKVVFQNGKKE